MALAHLGSRLQALQLVEGDTALGQQGTHHHDIVHLIVVMVKCQKLEALPGRSQPAGSTCS